MTDTKLPAPLPDPALQKAADILEHEDEEVVGYIIQLLATVRDGTAWEPKHTSSALKITSDYVNSQRESKTLEIEMNERAAARKQVPIILTLAFAGAIGLSWLFLHFGRPEFIVAVLTGLSGFVGGYGAGIAKAKKDA